MKFKVKHQNSSVTIKNDKLPGNSSLHIDAITDNIIRIHTVPGIEDFKSHSFAIENMPEKPGSFNISSNKHAITAATDCVTLKIKKSLQIDIYNKNGSLVCSDIEDTSSIPDNLSEEEIAQLIQEGHITDTSDMHFKYKVTKKLTGSEVFYGLGDKTGFLDKKGYNYIMWNSDNPDPHVENPTFRAPYT